MSMAPRGCILCLLLSLTAGCGQSQAGGSFVVLLYHHVSEDTPRITSVTPEEFAAQMGYLAEHGFSVWPLDKALDALNGGAALPGKTVVITFDDAYSDIYTNAWPILQAHGFPFTVFVATQAVDQGHGGIMTWEQLRDLHDAGVILANHSHTHNHLLRHLPGENEAAWLARVRQDLLTARQRLQAETGAQSDLLAWPYGEYNAALDALATEMGFTAFTQASGAVGTEYDPQRLPRFPVAGAFADLDELKNKFDALPLPVTRAEPGNPQLSPTETRPTLTLTLGEGHFKVDAVTCYVSGQGAVQPEKVAERIIRIQAPALLPPGRSRYNCTAPSTQNDRWYWYSHPWFLPQPRKN